MELSTEQLNTLTSLSTFAQAIFTLFAVIGAVMIGRQQMKYMKEQNNISKEQISISDEQTKIANRQAEIAKTQANISNDSFEMERKSFLLEKVYSPIIDDLMSLDRRLNPLQLAVNVVPTRWRQDSIEINNCIVDIEKKIWIDKSHEKLYKECINSIKAAVNCVDQHVKKGTFFISSEYSKYEGQYRPLYQNFLRKYMDITASLLK
ncbi:hypothetical protein [Pectinatus frisingensis]|uniref:hypothetical protein n=1 Tax=Pectinatus frisingensis TaxID=865 RepID=UPI003D8094B7